MHALTFSENPIQDGDVIRREIEKFCQKVEAIAEIGPQPLKTVAIEMCVQMEATFPSLYLRWMLALRYIVKQIAADADARN